MKGRLSDERILVKLQKLQNRGLLSFILKGLFYLVLIGLILNYFFYFWEKVSFLNLSKGFYVILSTFTLVIEFVIFLCFVEEIKLFRNFEYFTKVFLTNKRIVVKSKVSKKVEMINLKLEDVLNAYAHSKANPSKAIDLTLGIKVGKNEVMKEAYSHILEDENDLILNICPMNGKMIQLEGFLAKDIIRFEEAFKELKVCEVDKTLD